MLYCFRNTVLDKHGKIIYQSHGYDHHMTGLGFEDQRFDRQGITALNRRIYDIYSIPRSDITESTRYERNASEIASKMDGRRMNTSHGVTYRGIKSDVLSDRRLRTTLYWSRLLHNAINIMSCGASDGSEL